VEITGSIHVAIDSDGQAARDAARPLIATYLAGFPYIARESGLDPDLLDRIASLYRDQGQIAAAALVSDAIVDALACVGAIDEVRRGLEVRRQAGVTLPIVSLADSHMATWLGELPA
jgi:hypothetical protein